MKSNKLLKRIVAMGLCIALLSGDATLMNAEASENNTISTESLENVGASVGESEEMPSVVNEEIVEESSAAVETTESKTETESVETTTETEETSTETEETSTETEEATTESAETEEESTESLEEETMEVELLSVNEEEVASSVRYLIGLSGTANNAEAIVKDSSFVEVISQNGALANEEGGYSFYANTTLDTEKYYLRVVVEYDGNVIATSPAASDQSAYFGYADAAQLFAINPADDYIVSSVSLDVTKSVNGAIEKTCTVLEGEEGTYSCTLSKLAGNGVDTELFLNELRIVLSDSESNIGETENFKANLFKYNQYAMNNASKAINPLRYLSIGVSGDASWNTNHYEGAYQNLAGSTLVDGMITFPNYAAVNFFTSTSKDDSRSDYYTISESEKISYYNVTFPFQKNGNEYLYDSSTMSATLNTENGEISLGSANGGFWPFGVSNVYFGMNFVTDFYMTEDGKIDGEDIVFEFSGDDDVWVYIDGKLVLDLGGIHGAVGGSVNFNTGEVTFYNAGTDISQKGAIYSASKADYITATSTSGSSVVTASYNFYDYEGNGLTRESLLDGDSHELQVYYMERGASKSNCKIKFNLPQSPQQNALKVTNTVDNRVNGTKVQDDTAFTYVVKKDGVAVANATFSYKAADGTTTVMTTDANGKFTLRDGESAVFTGPDAGEYTVTESLVDGFEASYEASKNQVQTDEDGPVTKSSSVTTLQASHSITVEMNKAGDLYQIDFLNTKSLNETSFDSDKTATLVDWDDRTYDITLSASSTTKYTTGGDTIVTEEKPTVDVVLVLDISNSMQGTKLSDLKSAATSFVTDLFENANENSTIAVVTFNASASTKVSQVTLGNTSASTINQKINSMSVSAGTNHALALQKAKSILEQSSDGEDRSKYVILFTDGEPTNVGATSSRYKTVSNIMTDATSYASDIKAMSNSCIYTIQLGTLDSKYESWFQGLSSGAGYSFNTNASIDLSDIFKAIREEITTPTKTVVVPLTNATIVDVIDKRFELTDGEKERLEAEGAVVSVNEDGTTTITWKNQTFDVATEEDGVVIPGWSKVIHVVAKEDYIGGNAVKTNVNPGSYIEVNGLREEFDQPEVNVKIENILEDASDKIFLGESLEKYFTANKEQAMLGNITEMKTYGDSVVTVVWKDAEGNEVTADDIRKASPEENTEYYLTVEVVPNVASDSEEAANAAEMMKNEDGKIYVAERSSEEATYTVEVVTGTITITKKINKNAYVASEGDPIFTFKVTNLQDNKVYYRTVRFDIDQSNTLASGETVTTENHLFSTDYYVCSAQITDLPQGIYKVEELNTMGFTLDMVGTNTKKTNCEYEDADDYAVYAIGFVNSEGSYVSNPDDGHLEKDQASTIFVNKKTRTPEKLTDTDVVKNSLVIDETIEANKAADNMKVTE